MGRSITFPLEHGMARGYLARSATGYGDGVLVVDPSWYAESEHAARCDELAGRGFTALVVELRGDGGESLSDEDAVALLTEGASYLSFHPSVVGRTVYVNGTGPLVEACARRLPELRWLAF